MKFAWNISMFLQSVCIVMAAIEIRVGDFIQKSFESKMEHYNSKDAMIVIT